MQKYDALTYALAYRIESWDGYIIHVAKAHGTRLIYSVDRELAKKAKEMTVLNPFPEDLMKEYDTYLQRRIGYTK